MTTRSEESARAAGETACDPTDDLIRALMQTTRLSRTWEAFEGQGMSKAQIAILTQLRQQGACRLTVLASSLNLELSVASRQVNALAEAAAVTRDRDPDDKRAWVIAIADGGRDTLRAIEEGRRCWFDATLAGFSLRQRATAARVIEAVNAEWAKNLHPSKTVPSLA